MSAQVLHRQNILEIRHTLGCEQQRDGTSVEDLTAKSRTIGDDNSSHNCDVFSVSVSQLITEFSKPFIEYVLKDICFTRIIEQ